MSLADPLPGRDLAAFVTAVETGTVQGAADALQLTQSAATKRLQALERRVGRALLERGAHGLRPTASGCVLYPLAREALAVLERAEAALSSPDHAPLLLIHASRTIGVTLLPEWLASFRAAAPPCRVSATITNSEEVVHAVRDGAAEIGFIEGPAAMHGLRELVVAHDEIRVVVPSTHPWARRRAVALEALTGEPFLAREAGSGTRAVATAMLADAGVELHPALEVSSAEALKRAVLGGGFTLLSERVVASEIAAGTLAAIPVSGVDLRRSLRAVRRARPAPRGPARAFWRWLGRTLAPPAGQTDS
ncbi:MAG: transcriptional regulator, LysR family [Solirubrobacterales bacterium]|nr:transcriptional regulator, LysR family [Solirubrobacterales bacterium]